MPPDIIAPDLRAALHFQLAPAMRDAIDRIVTSCAPARAFIVGGTVRDLILTRPIADLDIAVETDAIDVARIALRTARVTAHQRFRTASAIVDGRRIDIATARRESYSRPGALPRIEPATIEDDMRRRDFTVNAMALRIDGQPELLDPCGGGADIDARVIRTLHDRSFVDDATRIMRALRYAARLSFAIESNTHSQLRENIRYIATIGGERLRREYELAFHEKAAASMMEAAQRDGALATTHAALGWSADASRAFDGEVAAYAPRVPLGFALLASRAAAPEAEAIVARLRLTRVEAEAVIGMAALRGSGGMIARRTATPSGVVMLLDRYPVASVAAYAATAEDPIAGQVALRYLAEWRHTQPMLSGRELQELGVPAGPNVRRGLDLLRAARLDGRAADRADEQALALRFAKSIRDAGAANDAGVFEE